jgi:predicted secreted protein
MQRDGARESLLAVHNLDLRVGQQHTLILRGRGSAGYVWSWVIEGDQEIVKISRSAADTEPKPVADGLPSVSYNVDETISILAQAAGRVTLTFSLRRPWEPDTPPIEEIIFDINVTG